MEAKESSGVGGGGGGGGESSFIAGAASARFAFLAAAALCFFLSSLDCLVMMCYFAIMNPRSSGTVNATLNEGLGLREKRRMKRVVAVLTMCAVICVFYPASFYLSVIAGKVVFPLP